MQVSKLAAILSPFSALVNRSAISAVYKTIEISPNMLRAHAPWGILEANLEIGAGTRTFLIDAGRFIAVVNSLSGEITFSMNENTLAWECGHAKGKMAISESLDSDVILHSLWPEWEAAPGAAFMEAIELGSLSCGPQSMSAVGVHGVAFRQTDDQISISSTDSVTMALCSIARPDHWHDIGSFVLLPDALAMLVTILKAGQTPLMSVSPKGVFARAEYFRLMVRPAPLLKQSVLDLAAPFADREVVAPLPVEQVLNFIKRAGALAESKSNTVLTLKAMPGAVSLAFAEGLATTDETVLVPDLDVPADLPSIKIDAGRFARGLEHTDKLCLDHIERGVLVLFGVSPEFSYLVCGSE